MQKMNVFMLGSNLLQVYFTQLDTFVQHFFPDSLQLYFFVAYCLRSLSPAPLIMFDWCRWRKLNHHCDANYFRPGVSVLSNQIMHNKAWPCRIWCVFQASKTQAKTKIFKITTSSSHHQCTSGYLADVLGKIYMFLTQNIVCFIPIPHNSHDPSPRFHFITKTNNWKYHK